MAFQKEIHSIDGNSRLLGHAETIAGYAEKLHSIAEDLEQRAEALRLHARDLRKQSELLKAESARAQRGGVSERAPASANNGRAKGSRPFPIS